MTAAASANWSTSILKLYPVVLLMDLCIPGYLSSPLLFELRHFGGFFFFFFSYIRDGSTLGEGIRKGGNQHTQQKGLLTPFPFDITALTSCALTSQLPS